MISLRAVQRPQAAMPRTAAVNPSAAGTVKSTSVASVSHYGRIPGASVADKTTASHKSSDAPQKATVGTGNNTEVASKDGRGSDTNKAKPGAADEKLSRQAQDVLEQLKVRDRQVHQHEAAHQAVGGRYAGAASYSYKQGPDGTPYAVGGEVSIDMSPVAGEPKATIQKMQTVRAAAMAPADPSAQDHSVAAQATQILLQARAKLLAATMGSQQGIDATDQVADKSKPTSKDQASGAFAYAQVAHASIMHGMGHNTPQRIWAMA